MSGDRRAQKRGARKGGGGGWALVSGLLTLVLAALAVGVLALTELNRSGPSEDDGVLTVARGAGAIQIAEQLKAEGYVRSPWVFRIATMIYGNDQALQAGEFAVPAGVSPRELVEILVEGRAVTYPLTIPEGWTTAMAMERIAQAEVLTGDMPAAPPEGALLPDTYQVQRGMTRAAVVDLMLKAQADFLAEAWEQRAADIPVRSPQEAVILASIVERETGLASERPEVAGVFTNRLRRGMRLESDPTVIYGVCACARLRDSQGNPRGIRRSELDRRTAYNTYQIDGLPPGPIANPGRESILAVLNPPATENLFFVAIDPFDYSKGHVFSETYAAHSAAVVRLRAAEAAAGRP